MTSEDSRRKFERTRKLYEIDINRAESERETEQLREFIANIDFASKNIDMIYEKFADSHIVVFEPSPEECRRIESFKNDRKLSKFFKKNHPKNPYVTYIPQEGEVFIV